MTQTKATVGLIGLGVMGQNIVRNLLGKKFSVAVYNRTATVTAEFVKAQASSQLVGAETIETFLSALESPKIIFIMVKAGAAVDEVINELADKLESGDLLVDLGNSHYKDTARRQQLLAEKGIDFIGCGVSGGEYGALHGPSLMPGGTQAAWLRVNKILESICASDASGAPAVTWLGEGGAGQYVKMVHNGIEYALMQILAEVYDLLRTGYQLDAGRIATFFNELNDTVAGSFLIELAGRSLSTKDDKGEFLIDVVRDSAEQKGTGRWVVIDALERGVATPAIAQAVFARTLSSFYQDRQALAASVESKPAAVTYDPQVTSVIMTGIYPALVGCYIEGFALIKKAAQEEGWPIDLSEVARIWQGGCIIRAKLLTQLQADFKTKPEPLFGAKSVHAVVRDGQEKLKELLLLFVQTKTPCPALSAAAQYIAISYQARTSANFIQMLRDGFGSHGFERLDKEGGFHSEWNGDVEK